MYRTQKNIFLKKNVTNKDLEKYGFNIESTKNATWAVREKKQDGINKTLIIKLDPPDRKIMFRYQAVDETENLLKEIEDMLDIVIVK